MIIIILFLRMPDLNGQCNGFSGGDAQNYSKYFKCCIQKYYPQIVVL